MARLWTDNAASTLATGIDSDDTTITLATGEGAKFPAPTGGDYFLLTLTQAGAETSWEIVKVTARSTDTLTIVRAQDGSSAASWDAGAKAELRATASGFEDIQDAVAAKGDFKADGSVPMTGDLQLGNNQIVFEGTSDDYETKLDFVDPTADRTITLPDASGTVALTSNILGGFKNKVINGRFQINQRVYISGATLAAGAYGHDRWKAGSGGGDYSFTQNKADTTITIAANKTLIQVIEDANVSDTAFVLSWSGTAQARYAVNSATPAGAYAASPILITGQTVGTTMSVEFNSGTLGDVQLEPGSVATPFESRPIGLELALCQWYWKTIEFGIAIVGGTSSYITFAFALMRATPSVVRIGATALSWGVPTSTNVTNGGLQLGNTGAANVGGLFSLSAEL